MSNVLFDVPGPKARLRYRTYAVAGAIRSYLSERGENQLIGLLWVALGFIILVAVLSFVQRSLEKRWSVAR